MNDFDFTDKQIERYSRHIILPEVGGTGQKKILDANILIIGVEGLGCPSAYYLTAAGVGYIGIVDFYGIDLSNLQVIETLKLILNIGESLIGQILIYNALNFEFCKLKL